VRDDQSLVANRLILGVAEMICAHLRATKGRLMVLARAGAFEVVAM
jgi:hypothetical protein